MPDTVAKRQRARMIEALKKSEIELLEAKLESVAADAQIRQAIENSLGAVRFAIKRSATLSPGTKTGPKVIK